MRNVSILSASTVLLLGLATAAFAGCSGSASTDGATQGNAELGGDTSAREAPYGCTCAGLATARAHHVGHDAGKGKGKGGAGGHPTDDADGDGDDHVDGDDADGDEAGACADWIAAHCDAGAAPPPPTTTDGGATTPPSTSTDAGVTTPPSTSTDAGVTTPPSTSTDAGSTASDAGSTTPPSTATDAGSTAPPSPTVSFSKQVQPIFTSSCAGCHDKGGQSPNLVAGSSYASIVGQPASRCGSADYVVPGHPESSFLVAAITSGASVGACSGGFMASHIQSADRTTIVTWVTEGAPNN